jgi:hypothetical protein
MKKTLVVFFAVLLVALFGTASFAILKGSVLGASYAFSGGSLAGGGIQIELPLAPLLETNIEAIICAGRSGSIDYSFIPISLNVDRQVPLTPFYFGGGAGLAMISSSGITVPAAFIYNVHLGYKKSVAPFVEGFATIGYEAVNFASPTSGTFPLPSTNLSGASAKVGISAGL